MSSFKGECQVPLVKEQEIVLAQINSDDPAGTATLDPTWRATNPCVRLHLTFEAYVRRGNLTAAPGVAHDYAGETWQVQALAMVRGNGDIPLNFVFRDPADPATALARAIPDSYETETGIKKSVGTMHCAPAVAAANGDLYCVRARWEPAADCEMSDDERAYWFGKCEIVADSAQIPSLVPPES